MTLPEPNLPARARAKRGDATLLDGVSEAWPLPSSDANSRVTRDTKQSDRGDRLDPKRSASRYVILTELRVSPRLLLSLLAKRQDGDALAFSDTC